MTVELLREFPERQGYFCRSIVTEHWLKFGCASRATVFYRNPSGDLEPRCERRAHQDNALRAGWERA